MKGSCLCRQIVYQVDQLASPIAHCSCQTCRKAHSAAFNSSAAVKDEHFRWLKGEQHLKAYASSEGKLRYFCGQCGSHLVAKREGQAHWVLRVASLNEDPGIRPSYRIWQSHEVAWLDYHEDIPSYAEWQPGRK